MRYSIAVGVLASVGAGTCLGQNQQQPAAQEKPDPGTVSLTLFAWGEGAPAVVRVKKRVEMGMGENRIQFEVPRAIAPSSVSIGGDGVWLADSQVVLPAAQPDQLLKSYVGHDVLINRKQGSGGAGDRPRPETLSGKLLSIDEKSLAISTNNRQIPVQIVPRNEDIMEIKLMHREAGVATTPTLTCTVVSESAGMKEIELVYATGGMGWTADYAVNLNVEGSAADVGGWVSLVNEVSGTYSGARVTLGSRKRDGEIRYIIPRPAEIGAEGMKRVAMFEPKRKVEATGVMVFFPREIDPGFLTAVEQMPSDPQQSPVFEGVMVAVDPGSRLPSGSIRVSQSDGGGGAKWVREGKVSSTPAGQGMLVGTGVSDVMTGKRKRTVRRIEGAGETPAPGMTEESVEVMLANRSEKPTRVWVAERMAKAGAKVVGETAGMQWRDDWTAMIPVDVPAHGGKAVRYTVQYGE